jgi:hypothetical protein
VEPALALRTARKAAAPVYAEDQQQWLANDQDNRVTAIGKAAATRITAGRLISILGPVFICGRLTERSGKDTPVV